MINLSQSLTLAWVVSVSAVSLFVGNRAQALTFITFNDRATWQAAVGAATSFEDFNSFLSDTSFANSSLAAGDLTLVNDGAAQDTLVDVDPFVAGASPGIDGTPLVNSTALAAGESIEVVLPGSFSAFGFDAFNYDGNSDALDVFVGSDLVASFPDSSTPEFIGFIATDGSFDTVEFLSNTNFTFNAFDNVEWGNAVAATTPEPGTILGLIGLGLSGIVAHKRK